MAKKLEKIFNECLERMLQGESIESCLRSYPKEASELEPLLRTALGFSWRASSLQPRPEFKAQTRFRLEGTQLYSKQQRQVEKPGFFAWRRGWAFALTAVLVILFTSAGTVAASSDALPDEPLYLVKLATEQARVSFTFSDGGKARIHTQLAENRALEIATMAREGKIEQAAIVTEKLAEHLEKANYAIQKVEIRQIEASQFMTAPEEAATTPPATTAPDEAPKAPEPEEATGIPESATTPEPEEAATTPEPETPEGKKAEQLRQSLEESTSRSLAALENAREQAPEQAKPALERAIKTIKSHEKPQQEPGTGTEEDEGKHKDKHKDETQPTSVEPNKNQSSSQKIKNNSKK
ncbi:MAG: hypothetical protein D4R82_02770 [Dehalococcoidia bacterium]|nr:MAG: hypothetical protein D4R82_02770 [Dehalococcoidia bacterium]